MYTITTARSILKFYIPIILGFIFFLIMGGFLIIKAIDPAQRADLKNGGIVLAPLFGALVVFLGFYTIYRYFKNSPIIRVDQDTISINRVVYNWTDIKDIALTGKQPFKYTFLNFPMEGAKLTLNDGKIIYIFDDMYSNSSQLKLFIQEVAIDKRSFTQLPDTKVNRAELDSEDFETFKGPQLTSLRGITCWGMIAFFVFMSLGISRGDGASGLDVFFGVFGSLWLTLHGWLMHYFKVSQNFLVIKDHIFFWQNKPYRLSDIKEVAFETRDKQPNCLRIITKDFRSKLYPAGTLRDKTWLLLKDKLESHNITVRNECIPEGRV